MPAVGKRIWCIPEGYIPGWSTGPKPEMTSHETLCFLNTGDDPANVEITVYFTDREPLGPYRMTIGARRTLHVRLNDLESPVPIPRAVDFATMVVSDVPIVVQHTRLDSRQPANALLSTIAYPVE